MPFHDSAIELLELIASYQAQKDYEKNVPVANVAAELVCMWFDDFYHLTPQFVTEFTERELHALADFNKFYDVRVEKISNSNKELNELQQNKYWKEVSAKAKDILLILKENKV
jgi:hypothetical protein